MTNQNPQYFQKHVFFCQNDRTDGRASCQHHGANELRDYCKSQIKKLGLSGQNGIRINQAGCLDRCEHGPVAVIYPEGVWYSFIDESDIDEIIDSHLVNNQIIERLQIK